MIQTRPDWCISRQRVWGVPIAVFLCESCASAERPRHQSQSRRTLCPRGRRRLVHARVDTILPPERSVRIATARNSKRNRHLRRVARIRRELSRVDRREPEYRASDFIWKVATNTADVPVVSALRDGHARHASVSRWSRRWTLDEKGQAMSKSRGNDVDPVDIANRLGGEIVRLWTASVDFREDVVGSEALMQRVATTIRRFATRSATS